MRAFVFIHIHLSSKVNVVRHAFGLLTVEITREGLIRLGYEHLRYLVV